MGIIKTEEIVGYWTGNQNSEIACTDCMEGGDLGSIKQEQTITRDETEGEEEMYFCDSCGKRL